MNINYGFKTRAFLTILILFIGYFCCFLPYVIVRLDAVLGRHLSTSPVAEVVLILMCYLNSMMNPLVYYFRISKFREACRDIVPSCCGFSLLCLPNSNEKSVTLNFSSLGAFDMYKSETWSYLNIWKTFQKLWSSRHLTDCSISHAELTEH